GDGAGGGGNTGACRRRGVRGTQAAHRSGGAVRSAHRVGPERHRSVRSRRSAGRPRGGAAMTTLAIPAPVAVRRTHAPLGRLLRSELRLVLRRPRTLIALGLLILVPIIAGIGIALAAGNPDNGGPSDGPGALASIVNDNGLVLPVFALFMSLQ